MAAMANPSVFALKIVLLLNSYLLREYSNGQRDPVMTGIGSTIEAVLAKANAMHRGEPKCVRTSNHFVAIGLELPGHAVGDSI
jgi:hypothetical protein